MSEVLSSAASEVKTGFQVTLKNFEGPFDLLLQLINQHRLDLTDVALHEVTDEFLLYTKTLGPEM
ncbi:MAG: segregation/condensation protein A, partial [Mycobacteriaceae bacterium]